MITAGSTLGKYQVIKKLEGWFLPLGILFADEILPLLPVNRQASNSEDKAVVEEVTSTYYNLSLGQLDLTNPIECPQKLSDKIAYPVRSQLLIIRL